MAPNKRKIEALGHAAETVRDALDELLDAVAEFDAADDRETRADAVEMIDSQVREVLPDLNALLTAILNGWPA